MPQALYRVWRPMTFSDMVGQEAVVRTLRNQVKEGRIGQAYLFCGSRGTGKTSAARIFARAINCENPRNGDPCGACEACQAIDRDASFDIIEIDAASNSKVEQMRELLEKVAYPPQFGKYKVYIIDEVHMLSTSAFNALLKTLEEPPDKVIFIMATTEPKKVLPTVLSRCQRFDFGRFSELQIAEHLKKVVAGSDREAEEEALALIARAAEGAMRDALSILDMCLSEEKVTEESVRLALGTTDRAFMFTFVDAIAKRQGDRVLHLIQDLMRTGRDVPIFIRDLSVHFRMLIMARLCGAEEAVLGASAENAARYVQQAEGFSQERLLRIIEQCMNAEGDLRFAASPWTVLEVLCLRACGSPEEMNAEALLERISELELRLMDLEKNGVQAAPVQAVAVVKPKKAAVSTPAPPVGTTQPIGDKLPKDIWNDAIKFLKKFEPQVFAPLSNGKFGGYQDGVYRLVFEPGMEIFQGMLVGDRKAKVEQALAQCGAGQVQFEAVMREKQPDAQTQMQEGQYVNGLIDMFGREKVQIDD